MRYIISKVELIEGVVTHSPIGYTTSEPALPCTGYTDWARANSEDLASGAKTFAEFFDTHPVCHVVGWYTESEEDFGLPLITDISTLT
jgi:hypothetical protein